MLKGLNWITRECNNFLKQFGVVAHSGKIFCWYPYTNIVDYTLVVDELSDNAFKEYLYHLGLQYDCDVFLLSLLHEVGHFMTDDELTPLETELCEEAKGKIEKRKELTFADHWEYFSLKDETMASQWAVDFINNNPTEVEDFWLKVQKRILRFYELNNVVNE